LKRGAEKRIGLRIEKRMEKIIRKTGRLRF
jgi:hypothetical protein